MFKDFPDSAYLAKPHRFLQYSEKVSKYNQENIFLDKLLLPLKRHHFKKQSKSEQLNPKPTSNKFLLYDLVRQTNCFRLFWEYAEWTLKLNSSVKLN
jgi:hypothetical protein